jgi:signal peptidase II
LFFLTFFDLFLHFLTFLLLFPAFDTVFHSHLMGDNQEKPSDSLMTLFRITNKEIIALRISALAAAVWSIDAVTKHWANATLSSHPMIGIRNFLYFILGTNTGGSNGIPPQFMEFCLAAPAALMLIVALTLGRSLRAGKPITLMQQIGIGLFLGGALANWSERILHGGVTDFIFLQPVGFCIFNLADIAIDFGNLIFIIETVRLICAQRGAKQLKSMLIGEQPE